MRNLKKVLTLVLTVAMLLSVMVVGTGAAFSDQSSIKNTEAVDVCSALNIIGGFPDGSYRPTNNVTRAEMCKMICVLLNGGKEPTLGNNTVSTFTDVRGTSGAWAESYIESCNSQGIVSGVGGNRFNPNGSVTGTQAARMLLVAMGYNADNEKFTGTSWDINVNIRATQKGLYSGIESIDTNAALTRDNAAQMIKNALDAKMVTYKNEFTTGANGQLVATPVLADKVGVNGNSLTLLGDKYEVSTVENGILYSVREDSKGTYTMNTTVGEYTKVAKDYSDLLGQKVDVMVKDNDNSKVFGVYANKDSAVLASGNVSGLEKDGDNIKLDGTSYKTDSKNITANIVWTANDTPVVTSAPDKDGNVTTTYALKNLETLANSAAKGTVTPDTAASTIKLIDNNGDGKVDSALLTPVHVAKVTSVSKTSISLNYLTAGMNNESVKLEDVDVYDGIAKDDFVAVIDSTNCAADADQITKLDVTSAKVDASRTNESRVDGTWYKIAIVKGGSIEATTGSTYDFVIVGGVIVNSDVTAASTSDIAYISAVEKKSDGTIATDGMLGDSDKTVKARIYFQDKTNSEIKISRIDGKKLRDAATTDYVAASTLLGYENKMVTFSKLSDDTYDVKIVDSNNKVGMDLTSVSAVDNTPTGANGSLYYKQKIGGIAVADDAVVFVTTGSETKVLTGSQINDWADKVASIYSATPVLTKATNGVNYVKFAVLTTSDVVKVPGSSDKLYAYLLSDSSEGTFNGEKKMALDVWTGTSETTLYLDQSGNGNYKAGDVIEYTMNGDFIELSNSTDLAKLATKVAITGANGNTVVWSDSTHKGLSADLDKDCVFIGINDDMNEAAEGSRDNLAIDPTEVEISGKTYLVPNAYIALNDDGDIVAIIFDADDGELFVTDKTVASNLIEK